jgi:16S rRNA (adenine1518-N6/adenine1519-N6)-dimethyltransferase
LVTHTRTELVALLETHGLKPSRALGQNFVVDPNTVRRIARLADVGPGDLVVEIGAGLGSLTLALAETGAEVLAMEVDRYLVEPLRSVVEPHGVRVVQADALHANYRELLGGREAVVVANLPYNVATPLVLQILETQPLITRMLVMVQKEVGERFAAHAGDEAYGAASGGKGRSERLLAQAQRRFGVGIDPAPRPGSNQPIPGERIGPLRGDSYGVRATAQDAASFAGGLGQ